MNLPTFTMPYGLRMAGMTIKQHAPAILTGGGIISMGAGAFLACKASTKVGDYVTRAQEDLEAIENNDKIDDAEKKAAIRSTKKMYAKEIVKLYAPAAGLFVGGAAMVVISNRVQNAENLKLAGAYSTLATSFAAYRKRVEDKLGTEKEREIRYDAEEGEVVEMSEDGKTTKKKVAITDKAKLGNYSPYARIFDESCKSWDPRPGYNKSYVEGVETSFNNTLRLRAYNSKKKIGVVFLNEVYDALGIPRTEAGWRAGWVLDLRREKQVGAGFISFGLYSNGDNPRTRAFIAGDEPNVLLDFNVDGDVSYTMARI